MGSFVIGHMCTTTIKSIWNWVQDEGVKLCRSLFELVLLNMYSYPPSYIHVTKLVHLQWGVPTMESFCRRAFSLQAISFLG
jgi:hypothetical protein